SRKRKKLRQPIRAALPRCTRDGLERPRITRIYADSIRVIRGYVTAVHYEELRRKYPVFRYDSFEFEKTASRVTARFKFSVPPDISFSPEVVFESVPDGCHSVPDKFINNAVFHLGLIELFSYWKATASPHIEIHAGGLIVEQIKFWENLLMRGMGEFFYRNDIDFTAPNFVKITSTGTRLII